jgi:hypothetical protein
MKKIFVFTALLCAIAPIARTADIQTLFKGHMQHATNDPFYAVKNQVTFQSAPPDTVAQQGYEFFVKKNTAGHLVTTAGYFVTAEAAYLTAIFIQGEQRAKAHTLRLDYKNSIYHPTAPASLRGLFDDTNQILAHYKDAAMQNASLVTAAKFDVMQRLLYAQFKRLPDLASKYAEECPDCLTLSRDGETFSGTDELSRLYNHMLTAVGRDTNLSATQQGQLKQYVIASASLFKERLITPAIRADAPARPGVITPRRARLAYGLALLKAAAFTGICWYVDQQITLPGSAEGTPEAWLARGIVTTVVASAATKLLSKGASWCSGTK